MPEGEDNSNSLNIQRDEEVERQPHRDNEEYAMTIKLLGILGIRQNQVNNQVSKEMKILED